MLIGTMAFANNAEVAISEIDEPVKQQKTNVLVKTNKMPCFKYYDSCGGVWIVCHKGFTTQQLMAFLWAWDGGCEK